MSFREAAVDVLVVGAGPVGLTAATILRTAGVSVRIIDKYERWSEHSKAMTLTPRTLECFKMIGVSGRCLEAGILSRRIHHYTESGRTIAVTRLDEIEGEFPGLLHLSQNRSIEILVEALGARGLGVERGTQLVDVRREGERYRCQVATAQGPREILARFVVGADGSKSRVREIVGASFDGEEQSETFIMADIEMHGFPQSPEDRHVFYMNEGTFFTILPIDGRCFRLISTCRMSVGEADERFVLGRFDALLRAVRLDRVSLGRPFWVTRFNPRQFVANRFRKDGIFLVGDAAHIQSPIGAQGLNTGIQDAVNLSWKLILAVRGGGDRLLDSYHDERHPVALQLFRYNEKLSERVFGRSRFKRSYLRYQNYLLRIPAMHARELAAVSQFRLDYRGRGLVPPAPPEKQGLLDGARLRVQPGRRMPESSFVADTGERFDVLGALGARRHLVLTFDRDDDAAGDWHASVAARLAGPASSGDVLCVRVSDRPSPRQAFRMPAGDSVVYDVAGRWRRRWGVSRSRGIVVRPDGYVAMTWQAGDDAPVEDYFARLRT